MELMTCQYIVEKIDGDYAMLRRINENETKMKPKIVARALLPPEITEGTKLLYEYLQYTIL